MRHGVASLLTGLDDDDLAVEMVSRGAQDYVVKGQIDGILPARAVRYAIELKRTKAELVKESIAFNRVPAERKGARESVGTGFRASH